MIFFFKQKTAYEMRISDWSSDGCSSDLRPQIAARRGARHAFAGAEEAIPVGPAENAGDMDAAATDSHPPIIRQVEPGLAATSGNKMKWEERRVGKEGISRCRTRWESVDEKTNTILTNIL